MQTSQDIDLENKRPKKTQVDIGLPNWSRMYLCSLKSSQNWHTGTYLQSSHLGMEREEEEFGYPISQGQPRLYETRLKTNNNNKKEM